MEYAECSVRSLSSINLFKKAILKFFDISCERNHSYFDHSIDKYTSVLHARLRLNCCALNYCLFRINRSLTPDCTCGAGCETVAHYLLKCPGYAALRSILLWLLPKFMVIAGVVYLI